MNTRVTTTKSHGGHGSGPLRASSTWLRELGPLVLGLTLFVLTLPWYESFESRDVLGRWSYPYTAVLAAAAVLWLAVVILSLRAARRGAPRNSVPRRWLGFAVLLWGIAYVISAIMDPEQTGRIADGNVVGSAHALPALIELVAISLGLFAAIAFAVPRCPRRLQNAGVVVVTTALLVWAGEGFARLKAVAFPATQGFPTYSSRLWQDRYADLNSLGFRDVEHEERAADGVRRLLVIGDSYAFGSGIDDIDDRFGELTGARLGARTGSDWEVITGAVPDTHTLDHIGFLRRLQRFSPDVVVLLYVLNDIDYLVPVTRRGDITRPEGLLERYAPERLLFLNSYLYQELFVRIRMLGFIGDDADASARQPYMNTELLDEHLTDIRRFVELASANGASALVIPYDQRTAASDVIAERHARFVDAAEARGLPVCSLRGVFEGHSVESLTVSFLDGHPSEKANELAATRAAECVGAALRGPGSH